MRLLIIIILILIQTACNERFTPKPTGYLRIDLEQKTDSLFTPQNCQFSFITANYFNLKYKPKSNCWIDLKYPKHHATIHLTYKEVNDNIFELLEESRNIVYKHTVKADAINEKKYLNKEHNTYGTLYDIHGETASAVQFQLTDSISHFIRGALYFEINPNQDSLKPIIQYLREDIIKLMETLLWKNNTVLEETKIET